jgi:site-specific recombinase XerD
MKTRTLTELIQTYFTITLPRRGFSSQTLHSYRDALKLLLRYTARTTQRPVVHLTFQDLDDHRIAAFLDHLERDRGNHIATRNTRLAALRSFFHYVAAEEPTSSPGSNNYEPHKMLSAAPHQTRPPRPQPTALNITTRST